MDYSICPECMNNVHVDIDEKLRIVIFDCDFCGFHEEVEYGSVRDLP